MEKQSITVKISDMEYPLEIQPELEEMVRKAAHNLNNEITGLMSDYDIDLVHALSMILLQEECRLIEARKGNEGDYGKLLSDLKAIDSELGEYLLSR